MTVDVESVALLPPAAFDKLSPAERDYELLRHRIAQKSARVQFGSDETELEAEQRYLALSIILARPVCIGVFDHKRRREVALLDGTLVDMKRPKRAGDDGAVIQAPEVPHRMLEGEKALLEEFAGLLRPAVPGEQREGFGRIVTFNGRQYDVPLLINRMVAHGIKPPDLLVDGMRQKRFEPWKLVDMVEEIGHRGAVRSIGPLRAYTGAWVGQDPKAESDGNHVHELVAQRNGYDLARYCLGDVKGNAEIYERWLELVGI